MLQSVSGCLFNYIYSMYIHIHTYIITFNYIPVQSLSTVRQIEARPRHRSAPRWECRSLGDLWSLLHVLHYAQSSPLPVSSSVTPPAICTATSATPSCLTARLPPPPQRAQIIHSQLKPANTDSIICKVLCSERGVL